MRKINKHTEPVSLINFKYLNPTLKHSDLEHGNQQVRIDIRSASLIEQFYLCGYCCNRIDLSNSHNEHLVPQNSVAGSSITLDFDNNIIASCQYNLHCGHKKDNAIINLTPLMIECESEIIYQLNGKMTHTSQRAQSAISTLNLRNKSIENKRKQVIDIILFDYVDDLDDLSIEEDDFLEIIIDDISNPDQDGKLEAFTPVIVNVIRQFIT